MTRTHSLPEFDSSTNILVDTPTDDSSEMTAILEVLSQADPHSIIAVTYGQPDDPFLQRWQRHIEPPPEFLRVIAVGQSTRSTTAQAALHNIVRPIAQPDDLAKVQAEITTMLSDAPGEPVLWFNSLTRLLEQVSLSEVVDFFGIVSRQLSETDGTGYFHIDTKVHDSITLAPLHMLADEQIRLVDGTWTIQSVADDVRDPPPFDELFDILRSSQRRTVLHYLFTTDGLIFIDELTVAVARRETGSDTIAEHQRREAAMSLRQFHLPKLADKGLIEYSTETGQVSVCEPARAAKPFLALVCE